uniref:hypothetical protein n=1 Tax=Treponema endosymbiont of Eucomonympha sp. TaxID=1580831 RepID=UPI000A89F1C7
MEIVQEIKYLIKKHSGLTTVLRNIIRVLRKVFRCFWKMYHWKLFYRLNKAPLTNLKLLSYNIPYLITNELYETNDYYGQTYILKKYAGFSESY